MTIEIWRRVDPARLGSLARTSVVVGFLAGLAAASFATVAGEPAIDDAIAIEEAAAAHDGENGAAARADGGETGDEADVSRADQRGIGLFGAYALTGAAYGGLLALAVHGLRRGRPDVGRRVLTAGAVLAGALTVAPWLKYPPAPPGASDPATLAERQALYVTIVCLAALAGLAAVALGGRLRAAGWPDHRRTATVAAAVALPMLAAFAVLPGAPDPGPAGAALVWRFRLAALGANLTLWAVLVLGVAWAAGDAQRRRAQGVQG